MRIEDHVEITDYAVNLYWMFSTTELAENYKENIKKIQEGAKSAGNRIMQSRARNLHFYNYGNRLKPRKIKLFGVLPLYTLYPSSEHCLRDYIGELGREIDEGISVNAYELIGKILHLVQDVSSPPHVAPVFHSLRTRDSFEDRLNSRIKLYISNYTLSQEGFNQICCSEEYPRDQQCIESIYNDAAGKTIDYIRNKKTQFEVKINGELKESGWHLFWMDHEYMQSGSIFGKRPKLRGFGGYGPLGKHFGQERITTSRDRYEIHKNVYEKLSNFVVRKSIEDSIRIMHCIGQMIEQA
jgi:hypothetical protein